MRLNIGAMRPARRKSLQEKLSHQRIGGPDDIAEIRQKESQEAQKKQ